MINTEWENQGLRVAHKEPASAGAWEWGVAKAPAEAGDQAKEGDKEWECQAGPVKEKKDPGNTRAKPYNSKRGSGHLYEAIPE